VKTVVNKKDQVVCERCGHPPECHKGPNKDICVQFGQPCPCFPELRKEED